jgi:hypothetical protein
LRPAARAGLMSDFGLLPTIHARSLASRCWLIIFS